MCALECVRVLRGGAVIFKRLLRAQEPIPCYNTVLWFTQSTKDHAFAPHWTRDMTSDCLCRFHGSVDRTSHRTWRRARDLAALLRHRPADLAPRCAARSSPRRRPESPRLESGTHGTALNCLLRRRRTHRQPCCGPPCISVGRCSRALLARSTAATALQLSVRPACQRVEQAYCVSWVSGGEG